MKPKPRMCKCRQCRSSVKFRKYQRNLFWKVFRRKIKQKIKNGDYEMINFGNIINYFTD